MNRSDILLVVIVVCGTFLLWSLDREEPKTVKPEAEAVQPTLLFVEEADVRKLGGTLESVRIGSVLRFRAYTPAKAPFSERPRVPIADIKDVMEALSSAQQATGSFIPISVSPSLGVYEGKLALMEVIVSELPVPIRL